jgi:cytidylate kinase
VRRNRGGCGRDNEVGWRGDRTGWGDRAADRPVGAARSPRWPREARIKEASRLEWIEHEAACRRQQSEDKPRIDYVRRGYAVDPWDTDLYHLILNSTAVSVDTLIVIVARACVQARETSTT